ncbi:hypothetical protein TL18_00695 [Methanobrevibacter sp. YE315]|uniref:hypothetical protein n=1 Tax=Methanobrevibacter sp. YE315 TaxID=1609968 RepID=UPI000764D5CC|nr:hypothetical protein [Methanobrevibacter sp. YE315]AMD16684.1 hypothetical protein TL18_00695 [Methanobrevibacter sp. YE315]
MNGTSISGETVNITIIDENNSKDYESVVTDSKGVGVLKLNKTAGKYTVNCTYGVNENYTGNSTQKKLTIEEVVKEEVAVQQTSSGSSSSSNSLNYNEKYNFYYNDEGIVVDVNGHYPTIAGRTYDDVMAEAEYIEEHGMI